MTTKNLPFDEYELALAAEEAPYMSAVPGRAVIDRRLSAYQYRVFALMCGYSNKITRICWPKQETLARLLGTNVQVISKIVAKLIKLGYVEVAKTGFPARNVYRIVWADPQEKPLAECLPATELSPQTSQSCLPRQVRVVSPDKCNNRLLEQTIRTSSSEVSFHSNSPAQRAETAPPERRTRERFETSAMTRDPLYLALAKHLGHQPLTRHERGQWAKVINDLREIHATPEHIAQAIQTFHQLYPQAQCTVFALLKNWSLLRQKVSHTHATATVKNASEVDAERAALNADYEREQERWRAFEADLVAQGLVKPTDA